MSIIELDRASLVVRVKAALIKNEHQHFQFMSANQRADEAEKLAIAIVDRARYVLATEMNNELIAVGNIQSAMENREDLAVLRSRDAAAKIFHKTDESVFLPDFLMLAMGYIEEDTKPIISKLEQAGRALFGQTWQTQLAISLKTDSRRIRQWLAGDRSVPDGVWTDIKSLAEQRKRQIDELILTLASPPKKV